MSLFWFEFSWDNFMQYLAISHHIFIFLILPFVSISLIYYLFFTRFWWIIFVYFAWYIYDFYTPQKGSRNWDLYKNCFLWKYFVDYFPLKVVKTEDLPVGRNYIMGCHPHGILSIAAFTHLCTNGSGFCELFPGLKSTLLTLNVQFLFPIRREIGMALGGMSCSPTSLAYILKNPGKNRLIGIVIGGVEEALNSQAGNFDLIIKKRRGFCRYALQNGAWLVPSFSFGENDLYKHIRIERETFFGRIQNLIKNCTGFSPPLFYGKYFTCLPFRRPITMVVGSPIQVLANETPTHEQIEKLHAKYCQALYDLFEKHKTNYGISNEIHLNFQ